MRCWDSSSHCQRCVAGARLTVVVDCADAYDSEAMGKGLTTQPHLIDIMASQTLISSDGHIDGHPVAQTP